LYIAKRNVGAGQYGRMPRPNRCNYLKGLS
jgi:hypothetical protein